MLQLSETATAAIANLVHHPDRPEVSGLRIAADETGSGQLTVTPALMPEEGDQVVENEGARVYLEPVAAAALDDKILEAAVDADGRIEFMVADQ
ncbi:MAG TPA: hypothetical protein VKZ72_08460 [Acidimicrobiales bacterium]|jgi:iron-sulfur cluster assembly protein|nr:hypothetical protein [Acidimicrobiales bacterium]